jgi:hypothetical protein
MSVAENADEGTEVEQDTSGDDQPDIIDDDRADGADVFGDPDLDPDSDLDDEDEDDDESDADPDSEESSDSDEDDLPIPDDLSAGKVYCRGIGVITALAVSRTDDDNDRERDNIIDEYAGLCEQMYLDKYVDAALAERGGIESLSPGEKALAMTGIVSVMILVAEPALSDAALDGLEMPDTSSLGL